MKKITILLSSMLALSSITGCNFFIPGASDSEESKKEDIDPVVEKYTVSFLAIGADGFMEDIEVEKGGSFAIPKCSYTFDGYKFIYWAKNSTSGDPYYVGEIIENISSNLIFYAVWEENAQYEVSFNSNGGTGTMESVTTDGKAYVLPDCEFVYEGFNFSKWALNSVSGPRYDSGTVLKDIDEDIILFAIWEEKPSSNFIVSFYSNGGSGDMPSQYTDGSEFMVPDCVFTNSGYEFTEWALGSPEGDSYLPGSKIYNINSNISLYALWEQIPVNYTVSFDANGGSGTMSNATTSGSEYIVPSCDFTYEGHSFVNWALNSEGGEEYNPGEKITNITGDIILFCIWEEDTSTDDPYYEACKGLTGSALQSKLKAINSPKTPSYDWDRYEAADEALDDSACILSIYTRHNIKKENHCGNYAWDKWNREHVWTQSSYPASKTDNHNIFACEGQINGYRSDKPFAEGGEVVVVFGHTTGCKQTGNTFEPCDEAKGEIARSVMYGTVQYSYTMTQEIQSIYLALKWHLEHPITQRDVRRNEVVYTNQGNRNPFVDHPEYACRIWGNTNAQTKQICGLN